MATPINFKQIDRYLDQNFILDTNVWLYVQSNYNDSDFGYSEVLGKLLDNNCKILLPPIVGTEFVNRYCRLAFEVFKESHPNKKNYKYDFRPSTAYSLAFKYISGIIQEDILPFVEYVNIENSDFNSSLKSSKLEDLNDDIIMNIALRTKSILVTHDRDYQKAPSSLKLLQL